MKYLRENCRLVEVTHKAKGKNEGIHIGYLLDIINDSDGDINYMVEIQSTGEIKIFWGVEIRTIDFTNVED